MTSQAPVAPPTDGCPEPEQLAAYIDGGLPSGERTHVERHLIECRECRDIVGDSGELNRREPARFPVKWLAVGGLVAAAAALLLVTRGPFLGSRGDLLAELRSATVTTRAIEPRLTGDLPYRPLEPVTRSAGQPDLPLELVSAAASIEQRALASRSAATLHALGAAQLLTRDIDSGIRTLEDAATLDPANGKIQIDLAAAYIARGRRQNEPADFTRGLAALDRAGQTGSSPEALFNRALALEGLERRAEAAAAWATYLAADATSEWAAEARIHASRLPR